MLGLQNSGKSSFLNSLSTEDNIILSNAIPTAGCNIINIDYLEKLFSFYDVGGNQYI